MPVLKRDNTTLADWETVGVPAQVVGTTLGYAEATANQGSIKLDGAIHVGELRLHVRLGHLRECILMGRIALSVVDIATLMGDGHLTLRSA